MTRPLTRRREPSVSELCTRRVCRCTHTQVTHPASHRFGLGEQRRGATGSAPFAALALTREVRIEREQGVATSCGPRPRRPGSDRRSVPGGLRDRRAVDRHRTSSRTGRRAGGADGSAAPAAQTGEWRPPSCVAVTTTRRMPRHRPDPRRPSATLASYTPRGRSSMVEPQSSKLATRVRFPSPAPS